MLGMLAHEYLNQPLPLVILKSAAGYYIGTADEMGPVSRESNEYYLTMIDAKKALQESTWTQKLTP